MNRALALLALALYAAAGLATDELEARSQAQRLLLMTSVLPSQAVLAELERFSDDRSIPLETREAALRQYVLSLRDEPPDAVNWQAAELLSRYRERALVSHSHSLQNAVPVHNVAAPARGTLNVWTRKLERSASELALANQDYSYFSSLSANHMQVVAGAADALKHAPVQLLEPAIPHLIAAVTREPALAPIMLAAAANLSDPDLTAVALEYLEGADRFRTVLELDGIIGPDAARAWWLKSLDSGPDQAAAIAALGRMAADDPDVSEELFTLMGDADLGAAAALALGKSQAPGLVDRAAELLKSDQPMLAARGRLMLQSHGGRQALQILERQP